MSDDNTTNVLVKRGRSLKPLKDRVGDVDRLSRKDRLLIFSKAIAEQKGADEAYILAFGDTRPSLAMRKGAQLLTDPRVQEMLSDERGRRQRKGVNEGERLRIFVQARLEHEAIHAHTDSGRINALRLLGDLGHVQAFTRPKVGDDPEVPSDVEDRLKALAERLLNATGSVPKPEPKVIEEKKEGA